MVPTGSHWLARLGATAASVDAPTASPGNRALKTRVLWCPIFECRSSATCRPTTAGDACQAGGVTIPLDVGSMSSPGMGCVKEKPLSTPGKHEQLTSVCTASNLRSIFWVPPFFGQPPPFGFETKSYFMDEPLYCLRQMFHYKKRKAHRGMEPPPTPSPAQLMPPAPPLAPELSWFCGWFGC